MSNVTFAAILSHPFHLRDPHTHRIRPLSLSSNPINRKLHNSFIHLSSYPWNFFISRTFDGEQAGLRVLVVVIECGGLGFVLLFVEWGALKLFVCIYFVKLVNREISGRAEFHQIPLRSALPSEPRINWGIVPAYVE